MGRSFENRKASMAKTQGAKTKLYSKYGKEIYVIAKNGGTDPDGNLALRQVITKAKKDQVPAHVIEKAIDKAKGTGGENYENTRYEGFGPGGCMVIIDCLTDNTNRTIKDVRNCFTKTDSKIGAPGSAIHMFDHQAVFQFSGQDEEDVLETLMMADVDVADIETDEEGVITVLADHTEFYKAKTALTDAYADIDFKTEEITYVPQTSTTITGDDVAVFDKFMNMLDDCDDVQEVYHNAVVED
ncbi:YebC/PmpR family DNA-binding transcriptional regulator [Saccharobesus litoralis]|uniref:Probable transcriptional regulatory protein C2869_01880 n=1 Tax=Saccharobesus litoralis TaxID=2172099 RepID=A0A2S0VM47_9ALTE|nr:YebC/PmpR family DNA-binding transcriptional regulator [Saccharobesus litoralis]AWB65269.1 YebC/PmpR family DNA-binding transcriptional regulator [Saccharobesus litoralis]